MVIQQWWIVRSVTKDGLDAAEIKNTLEAQFEVIAGAELIQVVEMPEADREHYDKLAILSDHLAEGIDEVFKDG